MTTQTATDELAPLAAFAWAALAEGRTNVLEAVDWMREESRCEDVAVVKTALYGAAADTVGAAWDELVQAKLVESPDDWRRSTMSTALATRLLGRGELDKSCQTIAWLLRDSSDTGRRRWRLVYDAALALCRLIEAA